MIRYSLRCAEDHRFDSWFQSADAFDELAAKGLVSCAICGSGEVSKAMMAPRVAGSEPMAAPAEPAADAPTPPAPLTDAAPHPAEQMLRAMRELVEKHSTDVGEGFAREARAMHVGDVPERPIHGKANPDEARSLIEDGVPILPLPGVPRSQTN